jgi:hypothetical protein
VGAIVAKVYERKLYADIAAGHENALRLDRQRQETGERMFWCLFYTATVMLYGVFAVRTLLTKGFSYAKLR